MLGVAAASIAGFMRWRSTSYAVDEHGVHWESGIVRKKQTTVPLDRIQGLDTVAGPVQRLFGVVAVHVQTAGGGAKGEVVLDAVGAEAVERLREAVRGRRPEVVEDAPAGCDLPERRLSRRDGLITALTAGQLGVILPRWRSPSSSSPTSSRTSGASRRRRGSRPTRSAAGSSRSAP